MIVITIVKYVVKVNNYTKYNNYSYNNNNNNMWYIK